MNGILFIIGLNLQKAVHYNDVEKQKLCIKHAAQAGRLVSREGGRTGWDRMYEMHQNPINGKFHFEVYDVNNECIKPEHGEFGSSGTDQYGSCHWGNEGIVTLLKDKFVQLPFSLGQGQLEVPDTDFISLATAVSSLFSA